MTTTAMPQHARVGRKAMTKRQAQMAATALFTEIAREYVQSCPGSRRRERIENLRLIGRGKSLLRFINTKC